MGKGITLSSMELAKRNIRNKPERSIPMMILAGILCFVLFLSSFLIYSLNNGLRSLSDRMGADIIVVPEGYDSKITGAILRGEPNSFFFDISVRDKLLQLEGVEKASPQLYLATLSAGCCSFPLQIIGIDMENDFAVSAWLSRQMEQKLGDHEIIVGYNVEGDYHDEVKFFEQHFRIRGRLEKTGMGFDNTVFMSMEQTRALAKEYEKVLDLEISDNDRLISSVMIKVKAGTDAGKVLENIRTEFAGQGIYALLSKQMISEVSDNIQGILRYIYLFMSILWIMVLGVLGLVFHFSIKERKREFATLRILGATKKKVRQIFLYEMGIINLIGSVFGTVFALIIALLFAPAMSSALKLPFLAPGFPVLGCCALIVIILGALMGPLSAMLSIRKTEHSEISVLLRENE